MPESKSDKKRSSEHEIVISGFRYALSLTHHEHDAEDLVQQACLKIFRVKRRIKSKSYFLTTIRNLFYDACRRDRVVKLAALEQELPDTAPSQTRVVDGRLDVASLLARLSSEERELLYLNGVERFTAEEIGEITGKPRGTVLSQLSRAKQKLKKQPASESFSEEVV